MKQTFYSNGKLLITGEYVVLDGATALALPTSYGQYLHIEEGSNNSIKWVSKDVDGTVWFKAEILFASITTNKQDSHSPEANTLVNILHEAYKANPKRLNNSKGFNVTTELTFPRQWGLGTSSTLINNIAQWFGIDAYKLLTNSFGGSGYDIACAKNHTAILYKLEEKPVVKQITFNPPFADKLYFVYLNKKQNSRSAIGSYKQKAVNISNTITQINNITQEVMEAFSLAAFKAALEEHEAVISKVLGQPTVKETLFPDFEGAIKSLGAWGGDFVLAAAEEEPSDYFKTKGYDTIIPFSEMILK